MRARALLPLLGIVAVGLLIACFIVIGETPDTDDPVGKLVSFYTAHDSDVQAGGVLMMGAAAALIAWAVQARALFFVTEGGAATRATMGMVGSVVFAVGWRSSRV
jgi:hypothetical protein